MRKEQIFCDVCAKEFTDPYWDAQPVCVTLGMQGCNDGTLVLQHTCYYCRKGLREAVDKFRAAQQTKAPL
jgi:hypothetical protein